MRKNLYKALVAKFGEGKAHGTNEYSFECPKCGTGTNKFHFGVNIAKLVFHCFKCGIGGHLSQYGITVEAGARGIHLVERRELDQISEIKLEKFIPIWIDEPDVWEAREFLERRGIELPRQHALGCGISRTPRLWGRAIIPVWEDGMMMSYQARAIHDDMEPKSMTPKKKDVVVPHAELVFGIDDVQPGWPLVITEGVFDSENVRQKLFTNLGLAVSAVSIGGTYLSEVQLGKIMAKNPSSIIIMLDGDDAGYAGARKMERVIKNRYRGELHVIKLPEGTDPDELCSQDLMNMEPLFNLQERQPVSHE